MSASDSFSVSACSTMTHKASESSNKANSLPKKTKKTPAKGKIKKRTNSQHPPCSQMVKTAISDLNEKRGSSYQAIKKYISGKYCLDVEKISVYIKKFIKSAIEKGVLIQTRGKGIIGSFKLNKKMDNIKIKKKPSKSSSKLSQKKVNKKGESLKKKKNINESKKTKITKAKKTMSSKSIHTAKMAKVASK